MRYYDTRTLAQMDKYRLEARGAARHQGKNFTNRCYPHLAERSGPGSLRVASAAISWDRRLELVAARGKTA